MSVEVFTYPILILTGVSFLWKFRVLYWIFCLETYSRMKRGIIKFCSIPHESTSINPFSVTVSIYFDVFQSFVASPTDKQKCLKKGNIGIIWYNIGITFMGFSQKNKTKKKQKQKQKNFSFILRMYLMWQQRNWKYSTSY